MKYEITLERSLRVAIEFDAHDAEDARIKAEEMYENLIQNPEKFEDGCVLYDYALSDENDRTIIDWA